LRLPTPSHTFTCAVVAVRISGEEIHPAIRLRGDSQGVRTDGFVSFFYTA